MSRHSSPPAGFTPRERLELFIERADELSRTAVIQTEFSPSFHFHFDRRWGAAMANREPDDTSLRAFLLAFRQFISPQEAVYVPGILNVAHRLITSEQLRNELVQAREVWTDNLARSDIRVLENGVAFTPEHVLDLWLNGQYFHSDPDKVRELRRIAPQTNLLSRHLLASHAIFAARYILFIAYVLRVALREGAVATV